MRLHGEMTGRWYDVQPAPVMRGGQTEVRRAFVEDGSAYAVKAALGVDAQQAAAALDREADLVQGLLSRHPICAQHVVPVVDRSTHEGRRMIVMPWMPDRSDRYAAERELPDRLGVAAALLRSVAVLQRVPADEDQAWVHRDIKPTNAFVRTTEGGVPRVLVADFGSARVQPDAAWAVGPVTGAFSRGYAPVDQVLARSYDQLDPSWDVSAAGASAFALITGDPLASVAHAYQQCTVYGRRLLAALTAWPQTIEDLDVIERMRTAPLSELVHLDRLVPLSPTDRELLTHVVRRYVRGRELGNRAEDRLVAHVGATLMACLEAAVEPVPERRSVDADSVAVTLERVRAALLAEVCPQVFRVEGLGFSRPWSETRRRLRRELRETSPLFVGAGVLAAGLVAVLISPTWGVGARIGSMVLAMVVGTAVLQAGLFHLAARRLGGQRWLRVGSVLAAGGLVSIGVLGLWMWWFHWTPTPATLWRMLGSLVLLGLAVFALVDARRDVWGQSRTR